MAQNFLLLYNGILDERVVIEGLLCNDVSLFLRCLAMRLGMSFAVGMGAGPSCSATKTRTFSAREFQGVGLASAGIVGDFAV